MFNEIVNPSCVIYVVNQILQAITQGKLNPGDKLFSERELAEKFKISRPILREGISALSFLGIIQRKRGKGNYISNSLNTSIINNSFKYIVISKEKEVEDLLEARRAIECDLIGLAAYRRNPIHLEKLKQKIQELKNCSKTSPKRVQIDYEFHLLIGEAAKSRILQDLQLALRDKVIEIMKVGVYLPEALIKIEREHVLMYEAIKNSDAKMARKIMKNHIEQLKVRHIKKLENLDNLSLKNKKEI
jgi:GntR family transcriptional repressor for pyruvate dehydrogenase complex